MKLLEQHYKKIFQNSPMVRFIVSVSSEGSSFVFADVNNSATKYFDMPDGDMEKKTCAEVFDSSTADLFEQAFRTCVSTKQSVTINALPSFPGGVRVQAFIMTPVMDDNGTVIFIDVLARPEADDSNQLQMERDDAILLLTSLFDASGLGIIVTDRHGRIVRLNDAFVNEFGWTRDDLIGHEFIKLLPESDHDVATKMHKAFVERGYHGSHELKIRNKEGNIIEGLLTTMVIELSHKRRFMLSTVRDITERKKMVRKLRHAKQEADSANKAKSAFLANMSHELRTPLNAIIGFSELIRDETYGTLGHPKYAEYMNDIHFSARHLLDIINDVLDMSKIEAGKIELDEGTVSIPELFNSVERIMKDRALSAEVSMKFLFPEDFPCLLADQRLLRQILLNLLANSVKFSPSGSVIKITADIDASSKAISIYIADEGCGIPEDRIAVALEPFGQVSDPGQYQGQGTGLGLPLAKAMMGLHNGKLDIQSAINKGTTITLDFPSSRVLENPHILS